MKIKRDLNDRIDIDKDAKNRPGKMSKPTRELLPCLNPACNKRHFISDCPVISQEDNIKLRKEYRSQNWKEGKEGRRNGGGSVKHGYVRWFGAKEIDSHSSLFSASSFFVGAEETVVLEDHAADKNVIPAVISYEIKMVHPSCNVIKLARHMDIL